MKRRYLLIVAIPIMLVWLNAIGVFSLRAQGLQERYEQRTRIIFEVTRPIWRHL